MLRLYATTTLHWGDQSLRISDGERIGNAIRWDISLLPIPNEVPVDADVPVRITTTDVATVEGGCAVRPGSEPSVTWPRPIRKFSSFVQDVVRVGYGGRARLEGGHFSAEIKTPLFPAKHCFPPVSAFTVTADGSVIPIESLRVKYNEVLLKMDREIAPEATVLVTYRQQSGGRPLQDPWGRWPGQFTDFRVPHGPMFRRLFVVGGEGTEGVDTHIDFQVTMEPSSPDAWSIDYATVDGTAIAGDDYTATSGRLSFAPNEGSKTVSVPIIDDAVEDDGETFRLVLAMSSLRGDPRYLNNRDTVAVGKIRNTETPTTPGLSVADASATGGVRGRVCRVPVGGGR